MPVLADPPAIRDNFGGIGMIDMPSARMAPDGELSLGAAYFQNTQRYSLGFQALPWLEADLRYSGLSHFNTQFPVYWDRSFAVKARLLREEGLLPAVALGLNDVIGTGVYSSEYLVGSKQFGPFDLSFGIGWGRMASAATFKNPLAPIFPSFGKERPVNTTPGGTNFNIFFHGPNSGLFGGVTWQTPIENLSLIAEYSSDAYTQETAAGSFRPRNQINYGASYRVNDNIALSLNWLYGRAIGGNVSFALDPTRDPYPERIGPPPPAPITRTSRQQQEALNLMLAERNGTAGRPEKFTASGELADALWRQNGGITDVALDGRRLSLIVTGSHLEETCRNAARMVGLRALTIATVEVSNGKAHVACSVEASPALVILSETGRGMLPPTAVSTVATISEPATIDATTDIISDFRAAKAQIRADAKQQKIAIEAMDLSGTEALVYYANETYFSEINALDRLVRLLMKDAPPQIEKFRLIATVGGVPQREFDVLRGPEERRFGQGGGFDILNDATFNPAPMQNPVLAAAARKNDPRFSWDIFPQLRQQLFDPTNPLGIQVLAGASGTADLLSGLSINGEVELNIWDNFNVNRPSDSVLPHVRTDFAKYFTRGKNGIGDLEADYLFRLAPDIFGIVKAGYLESMFAGAGGEVLWRPEGQRWALGGDLYEVQQRDFDRLFGLQSYRALTGHISLYYASPWYGLNFIVRAGQYLAQDRGITFEMSRRFSTGIELGAFFTKTNVSSAQFGEGSFDKGIFLRIPLTWAAPINTQSEFDTIIRPVQRDGGQELAGDASLYEITRRPSQAEIVNILGTDTKN